MKNLNLYLTLAAMGIMTAVSIGVCSAVYGAGFDKSENKMYATLGSVYISNINNTNKIKHINKVINNKYKRLSNVVTKSLKVQVQKVEGATILSPDLTRKYIHERASRSGWRGAQWRCLDAIIIAESHYRLKAANGTYYGIFQHATVPVGSNVKTQWRYGSKYIKERYGNPCTALHFRVRHNWY